MNYLEQIQKLVQEKIEKQSPQERLEKLQLELKKENPDFSLIESLLEKGVGKKMTMEKVQIQFEKEKDKKEIKKRLELFNEEMKKFVPDISLLESLLKQGIGKEVSIDEVKVKIRENKKDKNLPKEFEKFVSRELKPDGHGIINAEDMKRLKKFLSRIDIKLPVDVCTSTEPSLIHIAVGMGDVELAQMLIDRGADLCSRGKTGIWITPLQWGTILKNRANAEKVKTLLRQHGATY